LENILSRVATPDGERGADVGAFFGGFGAETLGFSD